MGAATARRRRGASPKRPREDEEGRVARATGEPETVAARARRGGPGWGPVGQARAPLPSPGPGWGQSRARKPEPPPPVLPLPRSSPRAPRSRKMPSRMVATSTACEKGTLRGGPSLPSTSVGLSAGPLEYAWPALLTCPVAAGSSVWLSPVRPSSCLSTYPPVLSSASHRSHWPPGSSATCHTAPPVPCRPQADWR